MRTIRLAWLAVVCLAGALGVEGRAWAAVPLCLVALVIVGELLLRALPGVPAESGVPAARAGMAAVAGLVTLPLVALLLHAAGSPVRSVPLVIGESAVVLLAALAALLRDRGRPASTVRSAGLPAQRSAKTSLAMEWPAGDGSAAGTAGVGTPAADGLAAGGHAAASLAVAETVPAASPSAEISGQKVGLAAVWLAGALPVVLVGVIGAVAAKVYLESPRPAEPGYLSVALGGWAAGIEAPVTVPVRGLAVPVRVTSAGLGDVTTMVRLRIGGRIVAAKRVTVAADTVRSFTIRVPAVPPDGCLHPVNISVGRMSAGFYARGPVTSRLERRSAC
ncbi:hypothetical protein [Actinoplanes sp. NPDC023714]|uniref:hypothetical protein n=1 Tax=Actinoplanes sp. NPDC023714 TaxID=3154322 RepID=UPI0033D6312C